MNETYAKRLARAARLHDEQHDAFLDGVPEKLFTEAEKAEIAAELKGTGNDAIDEMVQAGLMSPSVAAMIRETARQSDAEAFALLHEHHFCMERGEE